MKKSRIITMSCTSLLFLLLVGVSFMSAFGAGVAKAAPASKGRAWKVVASPNPSPNSDYLRGVAAISTNNVWTVGDDLVGTNKGDMIDQTLIEHWNGSSWSVVASPNPGTGPNGNALKAVAAVSVNDVWAVGFASGVGALIEHWNGSRWSVVANPGNGVLSALTVVSANDIWAVGDDGGPTKTLIMHWNGTRWSVVASPSPSTYYNSLSGVTAVSVNNVWAVGYASSSTNGYQTLVEHWNGSSWSVVASPNMGSTHDYLSRVTAISANDIWAVGGYFTLDSVGQTLIEHWNGTSWSIVASPTSGTLAALSGVAAVSASNVWAVGYTSNSTTGSSFQTLIMHWNGTRWSVVASPNPGTYDTLSAVAHVPGTYNLWAVGNKESTPSAPTLTEFYG